MKFVFTIPVQVRVEDASHIEVENNTTHTSVEIPITAENLDDAKKRLEYTLRGMMPRI